MNNIYWVIIGFVETEKTFAQQAMWKYTFKVSPSSTKIDVANAVETLYWVKVASINTIKTRRKERLIWRSKIFTKRQAVTKAIVTLKDWKIDFTSFSNKKEKAKK